MTEIERINQKSKIKSGVYIFFMPSKNYKKLITWTDDPPMNLIFIGAGLDRRQRGRLIRRGLRFFKQKEKTDEKN